jgi:protein TonB
VQDQRLLQDYLAALRGRFTKVAHYPTGREASLARPQGEVTVLFELERSGAVRQAMLAGPSNSMLLDGAALSTVRRGGWAPLPSELYAGEASHWFTVTLAYARDGQAEAPSRQYWAQAAGESGVR